MINGALGKFINFAYAYWHVDAMWLQLKTFYKKVFYVCFKKNDLLHAFTSNKEEVICILNYVING